jgi:pimeloyl-ACP methyl ester carboxylesterase
VAVSGGLLAYHRTGGSGPPLVLSHGLTDNGLCWRRVAAALQSDFDVIMLDARGHGESSRMPEGATPDPGDDIAEAVQALNLARPILMGHSIGARATANCAAAHPKGVAKVILEDPMLTPLADAPASERQSERFRKQVAAFLTMDDETLIQVGHSVHPTWSEADFPDWRAAKRQVDPEALPKFSTPWTDAISRISAPILIIAGDAALGGIVTTELAEEAGRLNPNVRTVSIPGAGHNIRREQFDAYIQAVRAFLLP